MLAVKPMDSKRLPFDETVNQAYTHGLEQIYALETIDLSTVKKISIPSPVSDEIVLKKKESKHSFWDGQHEFELGDDYRSWIPPLYLKEPIEMLKLSQRTETVCHSKGIERVGDLIGIDFYNWIGEKGVGQGHIDEVQQKLSQYIGNRSLERAYHFEWGALLRCLTVGLERKKAYVLLQAYALESYLPISPVEKMELLNLNDETKKVWVSDIVQDLNQLENVSVVKDALYQFTRVFQAPWIHARGGVASLVEVIERAERVSEESELIGDVVKFFEGVYSFDNHPLACGLIEVEKEVFCPDLFTADTYQKICQKAKSYFYHANVVYTFKKLTELLIKEFGSSWEAVPEFMIEKSLKRSSLFRVRKGNSGSLEVKLHF